MDENADSQKKKTHRERHSGRKAEKKKSKKEAQNPVELTDKQKNPKAFAFNSAVRAERRFRRKQDIETKKQHVPLVDRSPIEPPPILVAVVGPPKVGKSTVINNLIKLFTKSPLIDIKGPVTIVTGKKRRMTLIECNNDINSMLDIAKVADLVLLLVDASFGFEMEIFEFLNICQIHGMPRIMGVLTHLDMIKNTKTLKTTKKTLKHRFWTEVYPGAKLFYLSGIVHGEYLRNEIKNLGRFISVIKLRPLTWRSTHSYLLGDRIEDLTNQEFIRQNPKCDRTVSLYGYIRGVPLVRNMSVHVAGLGDLKIADVSFLPDPCPLPETIKKRALIEKEKFIYAPFSGVGGIVYDKDAVYVELGGSHSHKKQETEDDSVDLMSNLIETKQTLDAKLQISEMQFFTGGKTLTAKDFKDKKITNHSTISMNKKETGDSDLEEELSSLRTKEITEEKVVDQGRVRRKAIFQESSDSELDCNDHKDDKKPSEYTILKENKDKSIHDVVSGALQYLDSKKKNQIDFSNLYSDDEIANKKRLTISTSDAESDEDSESDMDENSESDLENSDVDQESDEQNSDLSDSDFSHDSIVGVAAMKKKKDKIIDKKHLRKISNWNSEKLDKDELKQKSKSKKISRNQNLGKDSSGEDSSSDIAEIKKEDVYQDCDGETSDDETDDSSFEDQNETKQKKTSEGTMDLKDEKIKSDSEEDDGLKWKENLAKKARDAFLDRQRTTQNIMKLVYGIFEKNILDLEEPEDEAGQEIGGLFHLVTHEQKRKKEEKEKLNIVDSSLFSTWEQPTRNWLEEENKSMIENCFVTGKWKESEDANELLKLDDMEISDDEMFGDFEDLETGEKHTVKESEKQGEKRKLQTTELDKEALIEKKRKLKEKFDSEYDNGEKASYYDDLKTTAEKQSQLNRSVFENMPDDLRVQIEGYRAGMYVRIEFENIPAEFVLNFDPTYPIVIGGLNMGEENIGYVNVKLKKHRWYKKILKTSDPLIISLGWRRFQTIPLFSKLEDDLKYRYLKYTPEHVQCNAHFWGPITPQGTGFLAIQTCHNDSELLKKQGFRIAATGTVQELEKSTQIMKKLKLIGYPLKIYKKTAFIKDMFNSALEVAKFEGAGIKTVSGIRGQIKKAVSKPEGAFRATFEDKIQLSDIVFCRTWYKVDVPHFYCPVNTLLLPPEMKGAWKGARTTGQLKREKGIQNEINTDNLYTEIVREPRVFKPLVIPRKLHKELPYRDKPKYGPLKYDKKPDIEKKRVAVIREPHEQKIANMLKMLRATYEQKQEKLKTQMSERVAKHKALVEGEELRKTKHLKAKKKEVFRKRSKAQIREEKKIGKK